MGSDAMGTDYIEVTSVVEMSHMLILTGALLYIVLSSFMMLVLRNSVRTWEKLDELPIAACVRVRQVALR